MAFHSGDSVPYASPSNVTDVLRRFRERGMPGPVTGEVLERIGISPNLTGRTLQALRLLGFLTPEGEPTPEFEAANRAPEEDYKQRIGEILMAAYSEAIAFADPATDSYERVRDAFRAYNPQPQQERMITLFLGLLDYAGLDTSAATSSRKRVPAEPGASAAKKAATSPGRKSARRTTRQPIEGGSPGGEERATFGLPPGLVGLLRQIPAGGKPWTKQTRDNFLNAFAAVLDFSVPIGDPTDRQAAEQEEDNEEVPTL